MNADQVNYENERYFPNHRLDREIGLAEYEAAANRLSNDERALSWSTNASMIIGTAVGYISLNASIYVDGLTKTGLDPATFRILMLAAIIAFGYFSILHLAGLLKSLVFAERKIVVLRRLLGLSYGDITLVLPNWRVEGASNPFALRLFPGFISAASFPVQVVLITTSLSIFVLSVDLVELLNDTLISATLHPQRLQLLAAGTWYVAGLWVFRRNLRDSNENGHLLFAQMVALALRVPLVANFEDAVYRLRLEIAELKRVRTDVTSATRIAQFIEDRDFTKHKGINWRGVARALYGLLKGKSRGGGSSITQQLARGQFIVRPSNSLRRKLVEMLLARWLESCLSKDEILIGYLSTARFDRGIYGFHRAFRHYFVDDVTKIEVWETFVLIERLGNIRGKFLGRRVKQLLQDATSAKILTIADATSSLRYYSKMIGHHFDLVPGDLTPDQVLEALTSSE